MSIDKILTALGKEEMTCDDIATECYLLSLYVKEASKDENMQWDKASKEYLELSARMLETVSTLTFYADDYFRQYDVDTFKECLKRSVQ